jgi:hypothetical protein
MATKTVSATGGNFSSTTTWGGSVPVPADIIVFTSSSGPLVIDGAYTVTQINFTNYLNTVTFNADLTVTGAINIGVGVGTGKYSTAGSYGIVANPAANVSYTATNATWNRAFTFSGTFTAIRSISIVGSWTFTNDVTFNHSGFNYNLTLGSGGSLNFKSNFIYSSNVNAGGTCPFLFNGAGTIGSSLGNPSANPVGDYYTGSISSPVTINPTGSLSIGQLSIAGTSLTYSSSNGGSVTHSQKLLIRANCTVNTNGISWNTVSITAALTITLSSLLTADTLTLGAFLGNTYTGGAVTFAGSSGWTVNTFNILSITTNLHTLVSGVTYNINSAFYVRRASGATATLVTTAVNGHTALKASTASSSAFLNVAQSATYIVGFCDFTDINASGGREIRTFDGVLTRVTNVKSFVAPLPVGG